MRKIIIPKDEKEWLDLRKTVLTSTDIADLFGVGYTSPFELWHRKSKLVDGDFIANERTEFGLHLQDGIAAKFAKDNDWKIRRMNEFIIDTDLRIGSSFDFKIEGIGILEIKNLDSLVFKNDWIQDEDGNIEASPKIELQLMHQILMSESKIGYIGACVGGNRGILLKRERNENIINAIKSRAEKFWKSIDENNPPKPDFRIDAEFIASLYKYADPGKVIDCSNDKEVAEMVREYQLAQTDFKDAEERKKAIKAELLVKIGDAEKVLGDGFSISAGMVGPTRIEAYDRVGYRLFKVTAKKEKK